MFILYLILIVLLAAGLFFIRNRKFRTGLLGLFLVLQTILPVYGFLNLNTRKPADTSATTRWGSSCWPC